MANYCKANNNNEEVVSQGETWGTPSTYKGDWSYKEYSPCVCSKEYDHLFRQAGKALQFDWRLVAAHAQQESGWRPKAGSPDHAYGLFQFMESTWKSYAPKDYKDGSYRGQPDKAVLGYINLMRANLARFNNAKSFNDKVLLAIQLFHDGSFPSTQSYADYKVPQYLLNIDKQNGNHNCEKEAREYISKIMDKYKKLGGQIQ